MKIRLHSSRPGGKGEPPGAVGQPPAGSFLYPNSRAGACHDNSDSTGWLSAGTRQSTISAILALVLALLTPGLAQRVVPKYSSEFRMFVYYESIPGMKAQTNWVKSYLSGAQGQIMTNGLVRVIQSRLETYPPRARATNLVATSPESNYDPDTQLVDSTNSLRLLAINGRMIVRGRTGYEFSMTNNQLFVSNYVRGFIHGSLYRSTNR